MKLKQDNDGQLVFSIVSLSVWIVATSMIYVADLHSGFLSVCLFHAASSCGIDTAE